MGKYIGIPFVDGGGSLEGADCWGLITLLYRDFFEIELPHYSVSAFDLDKVGEAMIHGIQHDGWEKVTDAPMFGDVLAMSLHPRYRHTVTHVAMVWEPGKFIHTMKATGSVIQRMDDIRYPKPLGVYRWGT